MVSFTEIKELIQHPAYIRFMEQVQKSSGVSIEETLPDLAGLNIIAKRINGAKVNVDLLLNLIKEDGDCLHKYILAWLDRVSKRIGRKLDEEYPEGEEQDDSSVPNNVRVLPRDRGFIIYPIIVYHIIRISITSCLLFTSGYANHMQKLVRRKQFDFMKKFLERKSSE